MLVISAISVSLFACGGGGEETPPANLAVTTKLLTIEITGAGSIDDDRGTVSCSANCSSNVDQDRQIELTATATQGYTFQQWNGACSGSGVCQVNMSSDKTVAAVFTENVVEVTNYRLSVAKTGSGTVSSSPAGISCGDDCNEDYQEGTQVTLQANPATGWQFNGWSGDCSGLDTCSVTMSAAKSVSASFVEQSTTQNYQLNVSLNGSGTVVSSPIGINCGNDCSEQYLQGTAITLNANPATGYQFSGWSGACSGSGSCSIQMNSNQTVTATFSQDGEHTFRLNTAVTGSGTITSSPGGINCGTDCAEDYSEDSQVTLQATAAEGFAFNGWSGDCSGSSTCVVNMNADRTVSADFIDDSATSFNLNVVVTGPGQVTSNPIGINCVGDCFETYDRDTQVALTAVPDAGFVLVRWEDSCTGNNACSFSMTQDRTVTAVFAEPNNSPVLISNYVPQGDAFQLGQIPNNASGIAWHEELQQYLVVRNGSAIIYRYDVNFAYLGNINVTGINKDTEGLGYISGNNVMIVSEDNYASKLNIDEFVTSIDGGLPTSQRYRPLSFGSSNKGLEGVTARKANGNQLARVYACQEGTQSSSSAVMRVVQFDIPATDPGVLLSYDSNLTVDEPFNAEQAFAGVVTDIAGMMYDDRTGDLIIVSQESEKAIQVNPDTGAIVSTLNLEGAPQFEGVTLGPNKELVFVSEGNWIRIYSEN